MKKTRLVLALIVTSFMATPVLAASLTMLQFGSFETRDEAEKKLSDISGKYKDALGALPTNIREVKLPPDNLTVYRTQAGPVADRSAAQGICSKLAANGDECYIVQTAMVNAPAPVVATAAPATAPLAAEMANAKNTQMAATGPTPDLTSKLSTLQSGTTDTRDPLNRAALDRVNTPLADAAEQPVANTDATVVADQSAGMKTALDKAVADQSSVAKDVESSTAAAQTEQGGGFWSRMNPFSSTPKPVAPVAPKILDSAAPVDMVAEQPLKALPPVSAPLQPAPLAAMPVTPSPAPLAPLAAVPPNVAAATKEATPSPAGFSSTPVITQAPVMQLPPPPAPLKAQYAANTVAPLPAPEPIAAPISVTPLPPTVAAGTVQVEEAKRVPVTTTPVMPPPPPVPMQPTLPPPFVQSPVSLVPTATDGMKTIWAQIGPFANNEEALAYWGTYRQNHPDFPVVRVRVASSYQQLIRGVNSYTLRVGPMAQRAFVSSLCKSLEEVPEGQPKVPSKQCGMVSDLGGSSSLVRTPGMLAPSRYGSRH